MNRNKIIRSVLCVLGVLLSSVSIACAQTRQVSVEVSVTASDGAPVVSLPLVLRASNGVRAGAVTGVDGRAILVAEVPATDLAVGVRVSTSNDVDASGEDVFTTPNQQTLLDSTVEYLRTHCTKWDHTTVLQPGVTNYALAITVGDCVRVQGTVQPPKDVGGPPVASSTTICAVRPERVEGHFGIFVQKGRDNRLLIIRSDQDEVKLRSIAAAEVQGDLDLGAIVFETPTRDATIQATVTQFQQYRHLIGFPDIQGLTYVRVGDGSIWTQRGKLVKVDGVLGATLQPLQLPAGTYYIAPGWCSGSAIQFALIDAVRRGDDLTNSGVPKVTAVAGQTVNIEVDLAAAYAACHNLRRP